MTATLYMDYAASTPVDPAVAKAMADVLAGEAGTGNPAATHWAGQAAGQVVEQARVRVAALIGASPGEIVFTSGATEADNLAVIGAARFRRQLGRHIVTTLIEHPAVLESCRALEAEGFEVSYLPPDNQGILAAELVAAALRPDTILVSVAHVNNELGVVQPVAAIGEVCRRHGALLHVDAAQSAGRLPVDVRAQCIDLLALSAHKMYGPKGVGALFLDRERCRRVEPLFHGGGQERGLRPGTLPTHQLAGLGVAAELALQRLDSDVPAILALRERLEQGLLQVPGVQLNGHVTQRSCHIVNVSVDGVEGESLRCGLRDIALSSGSACAAESGEPSPVLRTLGRPDHVAQASLRFSLGRTSTMADVEASVAAFTATVARLRALAPA
ncbi:MAG: aminotransferase class V-fold PLP-dependent enzyme [Chromatiales bacterium]|nr:MAG: aminotransferase class V-fold PLP-dependent enzyme [Chromatiales bacterium]